MIANALTYDSDEVLIREYTENKSDRAATQIVRKYQEFVFAVALRYMNSFEDADDAAQEAFIKALSNLNKFRGDSSLKTWLYQITKNICLNMKRKKKWLTFFTKDEEEDYKNMPALTANPEQQFENKEFEKNFMKILSKLPEKQRETFALRYFDELPYEEISKILGTSIGGLKANYYQAVKKLAQYIENPNN